MNKLNLVVMAAGLGSRYGGEKQTDSFGKNGELIIDYSVYDSILAGFSKVIFVINKNNEQTFKDSIGKRIAQKIDVEYAFQDFTKVPDTVTIDKDRKKPLGTAHAVYCALDKVDGAFVVINADDFYGRKSFQLIADYLQTIDKNSSDFAMVGFKLKNTVSESGYVSRGVCNLDENNYLKEVIEREQIETDGKQIYYTASDKKINLDDNTIVSMNMWGFTKLFAEYLKENIAVELNSVLKKDALKAEYYLPSVVTSMLEKKLARVKVLNSPEKWHGVTYADDKAKVVAAIANMVDEDLYKENLWG